MTRKLALIVVVGLALYAGLSRYGFTPFSNAVISANDSDELLASAFANQRSGFQVEGQGTVTRILSDDTNGGRHQRFIIQLESRQTLLVAHNIDIAPRLAGLTVGDNVLFKGEYEWNSQGGVIHWTHRDPQSHHVDGWLKHEGRTYQ